MLNFLSNFIVYLAIIFVTAFLYFKWSYGYWRRRKIFYMNPKIPLGNIENPITMKKGLHMVVKEAYDKFKIEKQKHGGMYMMNVPVYVPVDLEIIKSILTKDFPYFMNHGLYYDEKKDPLSAHLFNLEDEKWKNMRARLTPTFTSGKMKMMFQTLVDCGNQLENYLNITSSKKVPLDIKEVLSCYTTDIIGSCAFGLECNSFKDPDADFRKYGRQVFETNFTLVVRNFFTFVAPGLNKFFQIKSTTKEVSTFFLDVFKKILDERTRTGAKRNDFVQIILDMKAKSEALGSSKSLTFEQMAAQAFVFFLAGFETSSTAMTFCLYELAFNQDIQEKLRTEIEEVSKKYNGKLTYDGIMEMTYLDQVVNETLRKYPPVPFLNRHCSRDYKVPGTDLIIEKDTNVFISSLGIQWDEEYYPNSQKFDPNRFSDENKAKRSPYTFLPFGEGPRACIGLRFGTMQTKVGLCIILKKYKVYPHESTDYPIKFDPRSIILTAQEKILLNVFKISNQK